jgi:hypothetical protein
MKYFVLLINILAFYTTTTMAYSQSFGDEMIKWANESKEWHSLNTPDLIQKIPLLVSDLTPEHLSDTSTATSSEKKQIEKAILKRTQLQFEYRNILINNIRPLEAAVALAKNSEFHNARMIAYLNLLKTGAINYGQYNQLKKNINKELIAKGNLIAEDYNIKEQLKITQTSR